MRLNIDKEQFIKALTTASKAAAKGGADPLLTNLKLELSERGLEVTGTNREITIQCLVPYRIGDKEIIRSAGLGSALISAKTLLEYVRRMDGTEISLEIIDDTIAKLDDNCSSSIKLNCAKAESFTDIDLEPSGTIVSVPCSVLAEIADQTAFAASVKESRPILTAVNLEANNGTLIAVTTDSARLARKTVAIDSDARFNCNVPAKTLIEVVHLFGEAEKVTIAVSDSSILFIFENTIVCSRLIAGAYPALKSAIPEMFNYYLEVNAQELLNALSRASLLSAERDYVVKLTMSEDAVEISSRGDTTGSALEYIQTFRFTGERLETSFSSPYVVDAVRALKSEDVRICFQAEMKPFVIVAPGDDSVVELITPVRTY